MGSGYGVHTPVQDARVSPCSPVQDAVQGLGHSPGQRVRTSVARGPCGGSRGVLCVCPQRTSPQENFTLSWDAAMLALLVARLLPEALVAEP